MDDKYLSFLMDYVNDNCKSPSIFHTIFENEENITNDTIEEFYWLWHDEDEHYIVENDLCTLEGNGIYDLIDNINNDVYSSANIYDYIEEVVCEYYDRELSVLDFYKDFQGCSDIDIARYFDENNYVSENYFLVVFEN